MGNDMSSKKSGRQDAEGTSVHVHIYNAGTTRGLQALNRVLRHFGTGIFHCGVEVHNKEWSFDEDGVYASPPKGCQGHTYCDTIFMGNTTMTMPEIMMLLQKLNRMWLDAGYDLLTRNCCHWASSFCSLLGVGHLPKWLTSLADAGAAIVASNEVAGGSKATFQAEWSTSVEDSRCPTPDLLGLGKAVTPVKAPNFQVSKPGSQTSGAPARAPARAPAYAWQGLALKHSSVATLHCYGQVYFLDEALCTPQILTTACRQPAAPCEEGRSPPARKLTQL